MLVEDVRTGFSKLFTWEQRFVCYCKTERTSKSIDTEEGERRLKGGILNKKEQYQENSYLRSKKHSRFQHEVHTCETKSSCRNPVDQEHYQCIAMHYYQFVLGKMFRCRRMNLGLFLGCGRPLDPFQQTMCFLDVASTRRLVWKSLFSKGHIMIDQSCNLSRCFLYKKMLHRSIKDLLQRFYPHIYITIDDSYVIFSFNQPDSYMILKKKT